MTIRLIETCSYILWYLCCTVGCVDDVDNCFVDIAIVGKARKFFFLRSHKLTAYNSSAFQDI